MPRDLQNAAERVEALHLRRPGAYQLARVLSLAARIEFPLLRLARQLLPNVDASAEADVCASEIVASQTPQGFMLDAYAADVLRRELARDPELLEQAWHLIAHAHRDAPWPLRSEEHINRLSLSNDPADADRIQRLLLAGAREMVESNDRVGAARWMMRSLMRLPPGAGDSEAGRAIQAGVAVHLDGRLDLDATNLPADAFENWFPWLMPRGGPSVDVAVSLLDGFLELGGADASGVITIPDTKPLIVDVSWHDGVHAQGERVTLENAERRQVRITSQDVELRALDGRRYRVRASGETRPDRGGIDFSAIRARHRPFLGRAKELGELDTLISPSRAAAQRVCVSGEHGIGKTALLCRLLDRLEEQGQRVLTHFLDGGPDAWRRPEMIEASLRAQMSAWPLSSTGGDEPATLVGELARHARSGAIYIVIDGFDAQKDDELLRWKTDFLVTTRFLVTVVWTERRPLVSDPPTLHTIDLNERQKSNVYLCSEYLRVCRPALRRFKGPSRVFLSFSSDDVELASRVRETLSALGHEVFQAAQAQAGVELTRELERTIREADVVVFMAARSSASSQWAQRDVEWGLQAGKPIVPIAFHGTISRDPVLELLPDVQLLVADIASDIWKQQLEQSIAHAAGSPAVESVLLERADGNMGRLVAMLEWIAAQRSEHVDLSRTPPVLYGAFERVWSMLVSGPDGAVVQRVAAVLAAAREPIAFADFLGGRLNLSVGARQYEKSTAESALKSLEAAGLVTTLAGAPGSDVEVPDRVALSHDAVRSAILGKINAGDLRDMHSLLVDWKAGSTYWLKHGLSHLIDAGRIDEAIARVSNLGLLTAVSIELGVDNLEAQLADAIERIKKS